MKFSLFRKKIITEKSLLRQYKSSALHNAVQCGTKQCTAMWYSLGQCTALNAVRYKGKMVQNTM